jgi:hypothetical protein
MVVDSSQFLTRKLIIPRFISAVSLPVPGEKADGAEQQPTSMISMIHAHVTQQRYSPCTANIARGIVFNNT